MWVVLFASLLVQTSASFGNQAVSPLAPSLTGELGLSRSQVGLVVTAFYGGAVLLLTAAGWISDRLGVRRMFLFGLIGCGLPLVLAAQADGLPFLVAAMFVGGLGNALALPPTTRAIIYWFPPRTRGLAMGIKQTGVALAGAIMGLVVPQLVPSLGWRGSLAAIGWFTAAAGLLAWLLYREHPDAQRGQAANRSAGASLHELLGNRNLILLSAASLFLAAIQLSLVGFMVLFLKERLGFDAVVAGGLLALAQSAGIAGRIGWGVVSDLLFGGQRKVVMLIIAAGSTVSAFGLSLIGPGLAAFILPVLLVLTGLSAIGWNGINMTFVAELAGRRASATAAGLNLTGSYLGIMAGPPLFGLLVDATGSYVPAYLAAGLLGLIAFVLIAQIRVDPQP
jgi:sugar phosphate permease